MKMTDQIIRRMGSNNTLVCCGLDPDPKKLPSQFLALKISDEEKVFEFLKTVVDIVSMHVCAFKAQKAYFDVLPNGHSVLKKVINYIHTTYPGVSVIVDCKIGDIENTMTAYIQNIFVELQADGVVVNPYMGDDVIVPLSRFGDKAIVVLVRTSNTSGGLIQDVILKGGQPLWGYMLDLVVNRWNYNRNMIPVISSTAGLDMSKIRSLIPDDMPILLAGVGAQGGDHTTISELLNSDDIGVFVNSSRAILYPQSDKPWHTAVKEAVVELKESLNRGRIKK